MKQLIVFILSIAWVLAFIGGTGYCFHFHKPLFAIACLINGFIAMPTIITLWKKVHFNSDKTWE